MTPKPKDDMFIPVPQNEWVKLSLPTQIKIGQIEEHTCEFIRYLYSDDQEAATEILKRIGFVELHWFQFPY